MNKLSKAVKKNLHRRLDQLIIDLRQTFDNLNELN